MCTHAHSPPPGDSVSSLSPFENNVKCLWGHWFPVWLSLKLDTSHPEVGSNKLHLLDCTFWRYCTWMSKFNSQHFLAISNDQTWVLVTKRQLFSSPFSTDWRKTWWWLLSLRLLSWDGERGRAGGGGASSVQQLSIVLAFKYNRTKTATLVGCKNLCCNCYVFHVIGSGFNKCVLILLFCTLNLIRSLKN